MRPFVAGKNGASGFSVLTIGLRNIGAHACRLDGYPRVFALRRDRAPLRATDGGFFDANRTPVGVRSGAAGAFGLETASICARYPGNRLPPGGDRDLVVVLPDGSRLSLVLRRIRWLGRVTVGNACGLGVTHFFGPDAAGF